MGDSIVRRWGATDYPELLANWRQNFWGWNAGDFGWGADKTQHILWRLEHAELDGVNPKIIVILAGTNNVGRQPGGAEKVADITRGLAAILTLCRQKAPGAVIILTAIFPRNDNMAVVPEIDRLNANIERMADGRSVRFLSVNHRLADPDGRLLDGMMNPLDQLHPTVKGYQVWADGLKPIFTELLGPPAATDHAPPPTGGPAARAIGMAVNLGIETGDAMRKMSRRELVQMAAALTATGVIQPEARGAADVAQGRPSDYVGRLHRSDN